MPSLKNRFTHQVTNYDQRLSKLEVSEVDRVFWHKKASDNNRNLYNIVARDRREKEHPTTEDDPYPYLRRRVPSIIPEGYIGKHQGNPPVIRRGNALKAIFYKNEKPLILGPVESKFEPPVCRPDPYTLRSKFCQYRPLQGCQDEDKDFIKEFPEPNKPTCKTWHHGPCKGDASDDEHEPCLGRDYWQVYDYCLEGDADPSCEKCVDIDHCKRCKNTWLKVYSHNTMSCQSPNKRAEFHTSCGSYMRWEQETGRSIEYSEGKSQVRLGNAVCESDKRFHLNVQGEAVSGAAGVGTWDLHTNHEEVSLAQESQGVRFAGVRPEDMQVNWAYELINFPTKSNIRCYKDGKIVINSCDGGSVITVDGTTHKITIDGTTNVEVKATNEITLNAPLTRVTGNHIVQGSCTHGPCSCG